jgi:hypothetical protein
MGTLMRSAQELRLERVWQKQQAMDISPQWRYYPQPRVLCRWRLPPVLRPVTRLGLSRLAPPQEQPWMSRYDLA